MKSTSIGGFALGMDMKADETSMPKGTVREAVNVDFNLSGGFRRREGVTQVAGFTGARKLWSPLSQEFALFFQYDALRVLNFDSAGEFHVSTLVSGLSTTDQADFCEDGQNVLFTNGVELGRVSPYGTVRMLGVSDPPGAPTVSAQPYGGLLAGRYGCAYTFVNRYGDESGLSSAAFVELIGTGGIKFTIPPTPDDVVEVRLYTTPVNGDVFYQMAEIPAGLTDTNLGDDTPGKQAATQHLHRMPGGAIVRLFRGRILVARGDTLIFSEPFNVGLTSRRHNFVRFSSDITMIEAVEGGIYVGTNSAVYFLAGTGPHDFTQQVVSLNAPALNASTLLEAALLPEDIERQGDAPCALWLGRLGYSVGMPTGLVHDVQNERIDLPEYDGGSVVTYTKNGLTQVVSVVQSDQSNGAGSAIDSPT